MVFEQALIEFKDTIQCLTNAVIEKENVDEFCNRTGFGVMRESLVLVSKLYSTGLFIQEELPFLIMADKKELKVLLAILDGKNISALAVDMYAHTQ